MPPFWGEPGRALGVLGIALRAGSYHLTYSRTRSCRQFLSGRHELSPAL